MTLDELPLSTLAEVAVQVGDLAAATRTYAGLLGRSPAVENATGTLFTLANCSLHLSPGPPDGVEGVAALGFGTRDLARARAELARRGLPTAEPRVASPSRQPCSEVSPGATRQIAVRVFEEVEPERSVSPPRVEEAAAVRLLDHTVVLSNDLEATKRVMGEGLGLRLALDKTFEQRGVRLLFFRVGGTTVEIGGPIGGRQPPGPDRFGGLAWQVPDADAAHARLRKLGFELDGVRKGHKPGTRVFTVKSGTHGVPTLIIEPA